MQSIQFRWIRAFRAVALTGSTNGAAEMLSIGQSAVSKHIAGLEQQLGIALFDRSKRGLRLTPEGDVLFGEADTVLEGYERFRRIADDVRHLKRGHLHIIAAGNFTRSLLPSALAEFRAEASGLSLSIEVAARRETLARVHGQQFDVAVLALPFDYPTDSLRDIGSYRGVCILPAKHPLSNKRTVKVQELAQFNLINLPVGTIGRSRIDQLFDSIDLEHKPIVEVSGGLLELVSAGVGAAIVDPFTAAAAHSDTIAVRELQPSIEYRYSIAFPANRPRSSLSVKFAEIVERVARSTVLPSKDRSI